MSGSLASHVCLCTEQGSKSSRGSLVVEKPTRHMYSETKLFHACIAFRHYLQCIKRSLFAVLFCLPTSVFALVVFLLLAYNGFSVFYISLPLPAKSSPLPAIFSPETSAGEKAVTKLPSSVMYAVKEDNPPQLLKTRLSVVHKPNDSMVVSHKGHSALQPNRMRLRRKVLRVLRLEDESRRFSARVKAFFANSKCKSRFFMTWISAAESLGDRELLSIESLFKSHPNACLVVVSSSLDSERGDEIFKPFLDKGFKVITVKPDFHYLFKNTDAELWFNQLKRGNVQPGEVSLGQNLSNLLRLALLYKFGGIYMDTDIIVLRSFNKLRNVIGAQTMNLETRNWSRLNNAVLIFDKQHPLVYKFIQEFALTFDGNKWGHNGPYLVSRVVSRVTGRPGFNFTVLPPPAFYPVDWSRIRSLFRGPKNKVHSKWLHNKLEDIRRQSFAVHLWNRQSRKLKVQEGSIVDHIMSDCCVFCNNSRSNL